MKYLLQTPYSIVFCEKVSELYPLLKSRPCENGLVVSADNYSALHYLANINQQSYRDTNTDEKNKVSLLALPSTINQPIALTYSPISVENQSMVAYVNQGGWTVNALNGFYVAMTDEALCGLLESEDFVYPIAQWLNLPYEQLVMKARRDYVRRFYIHFDCNRECPMLPQVFIESFIDSYFQQREERREMALSEEWQKFQDLRMRMGW